MEPKTKAELRRSMREVTRTLTADLRKALSASIVSRLSENDYFSAARTVALFWPLPDEPDIRDLVIAEASRRRVALPVVEGERMEFRLLRPGMRLVGGAFGIGEPRDGEPCPSWEIEAMVVPGVAFDMRGHRLGRGRGYYDRYLGVPQVCENIFKIGLCYPHQLLQAIPFEEHDAAMDWVVTA